MRARADQDGAPQCAGHPNPNQFVDTPNCRNRTTSSPQATIPTISLERKRLCQHPYFSISSSYYSVYYIGISSVYIIYCYIYIYVYIIILYSRHLDIGPSHGRLQMSTFQAPRSEWLLVWWPLASGRCACDSPCLYLAPAMSMKKTSTVIS